MTTINAIQERRTLFQGQLLMLAVVLLLSTIATAVGFLIPSLFPYHFFGWGGWNTVVRFWPLFAEGLALNFVVLRFAAPDWPIRPSDNRELLGWRLATSTMAGIWEELGYRYVFICFATIGIAVMNLFFGAGLGWIGAVLALFIAVGCVKQKEPVLAAAAVAVAILAGLFALYGNPIYWFCSVVVWLANIATFTLMSSVLNGPYPALLVFGAVTANSWFRDGHKYQGPVGWVNSWYAGMVLIYATFTYGLLTAIVVHALYNIFISVFAFFAQRTTR